MHTLGKTQLGGNTTRPAPALLTDEQMRRFVTDGYLMLRPTVPEDTHGIIDDKFNWIVEHEPNPGNNILPRLPELNLVLESPEVRGAMISLLGENYLIHPHRYWHYRAPDETCPNDPEEVFARVQANSHQDSYSPSRQPKCHYQRYARFMYYSHDVEEIHGPTHVIPGSQYHGALDDKDRAREIPVTGPAGTVFLSHFELGHAAGVNQSERVRHMIKFIFMRTEVPVGPTWACRSTEWRQPTKRNAPFDLEPAWRHHWHWLCGRKGHSHDGANADVPDLISLLNTAGQADRTRAIYTLTDAGSAAVAPLIDVLRKAGERESGLETPAFHRATTVTMDDAAYALATIGRDAVAPLIELLDTPHEWTRLNTVFTLGEIGPDAGAAVDRLEGLLHDPSHRVIRFAANALGNIGDAAAQKPLCDLLSKNPPEWDVPGDFGWPVGHLVHSNAAMALARLGAAAVDSEADMIRHLYHPCGQVGAFLTEALRRIGTPTAIEAIVSDLCFRRWDASLHEKRQY